MLAARVLILHKSLVVKQLTILWAVGMTVVKWCTLNNSRTDEQLLLDCACAASGTCALVKIECNRVMVFGWCVYGSESILWNYGSWSIRFRLQNDSLHRRSDILQLGSDSRDYGHTCSCRLWAKTTPHSVLQNYIASDELQGGIKLPHNPPAHSRLLLNNCNC